MKAFQLKKKYIDFFASKGHKLLPNVSLVPENDPSALFINSGMHLLVPYLLGNPHPLGKKLVSLQKCLRTQDIESVGDGYHLTFFEMLGNWSLGDYWKKEVIEMSFEFLTKELNINKDKISVSCFAGDKDALKDEETAKIWESLGIPKSRIYFLGKKDNWWSAGKTGPCGPDTEVFYDTGKKSCGPKCQPGDGCEKYIEIWNDVFMEFNRLPNGKLEKLKQRNIDTGMGVERTVAVLQGKEDVYQTELFVNLINKIEEIFGKKYEGENKRAMRILADHIRAATFIISDGIEPSNIEQGYILRRLIRRAIVTTYKLENKSSTLVDFLEEGYKFEPFTSSVIESFKNEYPHLSKDLVNKLLSKEWKSFGTGLKKGYPRLIKIAEKSGKTINGKDAFYLFETHGIPLEVIKQVKPVDEEEFKKMLESHRKLSKKSSSGRFKGGLKDQSDQTVKYHTTTHLLHQSLRDVLGSHVRQVGSNITSERLRFDFTHPEKLTDKEIKKVEDLINEKIKSNLKVEMEELSLNEAKKKGALAFFAQLYEDKVRVYSIGDFSKEVCGGPHVSFLGDIGGIKIIKEKAIGAGRRRIYAQIIEK